MIENAYYNDPDTGETIRIDDLIKQFRKADSSHDLVINELVNRTTSQLELSTELSKAIFRLTVNLAITSIIFTIMIVYIMISIF